MPSTILWTKLSAAFLAIRLTGREYVDVLVILCRKVERNGRTNMFVEVVNYLHNSYGADNLVAKKASEVNLFIKLPNLIAL